MKISFRNTKKREMTFVLLAHFENDFNSLNQPGTRSQKNQSGFLTWLAEAPALGSSSDAFFRYNNNEWDRKQSSWDLKCLMGIAGITDGILICCARMVPL